MPALPRVASHASGETLVRLQAVGKDFPKVEGARRRVSTMLKLLVGHGDMPHFRALEGIDLALRRSESLALVGTNGAGKSTLLKIVAGVARPTHGTCSVTGRVSALLELGSGFHPDYTGRENIALAAALLGLTRSEMREQAERIVAFADIGRHIDEPVKHYSSGMVVRLGFAVATALRPDILITDEVLAVGDESFQRKCIRWIEGYLADGGTLLFVSHSMYHVRSLCPRTIWLHEGRVRMDGDSLSVTREYLAWHEEKQRRDQPVRQQVPAAYPSIRELRLVDAAGAAREAFEEGETLVAEGIAYSPDGRAPVVLAGVVTSEGGALYGTHSDDTGFVPTRISESLFRFRMKVPALPLLPGRYGFRAHALDPEGLRLFDIVEVPFVVRGEPRDEGLARLLHAWEAAAR